jgi:hypothetical protein
MIAATTSSIVVLAVIIVPGAVAVADPTAGTLGFAAASAAIALAIGAGAYSLARSGFDSLIRELPF